MSAHSFVTNFLPAPEIVIKEELNTVVWVTHSSSGERIVLKLYRHRGMWNAFRCWVAEYRAEREFERLSHLVGWDIPCTRPADWTHGYSREHGFYEMLATVFVPDTLDLEAYLKRKRSCDLQPLFAAINRMHDSGFCHHALYARNILISDGTAMSNNFAICDVPRSRVFPQSLLGTRMALLDVADLAASLMRLGIPRDVIPLDAYGLSPAERKRLSKMIDGYRQNRLRRVVRDGESRIRHFFACCIAVLTGHPRTRSHLPGRSSSGVRSG